MRHWESAVHSIRSDWNSGRSSPTAELADQSDRSRRSPICQPYRPAFAVAEVPDAHVALQMEASAPVGEPEAGQQVSHFPGLLVIGTVDEAEIVVQRL